LHAEQCYLVRFFESVRMHQLPNIPKVFKRKQLRVIFFLQTAAGPAGLLRQSPVSRPTRDQPEDSEILEYFSQEGSVLPGPRFYYSIPLRDWHSEDGSSLEQ
jgi:hypothetical protein